MFTAALISVVLVGASDAAATDAAIVGVPLPAGVLAATEDLTAPDSVETLHPLPLETFEKAVERDVLVGRDAWLHRKFDLDPGGLSDHGSPEVVFTTSGPVF